MFWLCLQRHDIPQKEGRGELLNPPNSPPGLRRFHGSSLEISNTLLSAGRRPHAHIHANPHTYSAGINPKFGWQPPTGSCRSSWISKHIRKGFSGQELTAPKRKRAQTLPSKQNRTHTFSEHWLEDRKYLLFVDILHICCTYGFRWRRREEREENEVRKHVFKDKGLPTCSKM